MRARLGNCVTDTIEPSETAPAPASEDFRRAAYEIPGGQLAGVGFGDGSRAPEIVFLHATGLNARAYRTLLAPLGERFHVAALDARGHGRTKLSARRFGYASWRRHRDDLIAFLDQHCTQPVTLAGHSMGATVSLMAAGKRPDLVNGLVLIDPVILTPNAYRLYELPFAPLLARGFFPIAAKAAKRRARFSSREEAIAAFTGRGFFKTFPPEAIADYVGDALAEAPKGGFKLACSPAYESATFAAQRNDPWAALRRAPDPIVVLRAEKHSTLSTAAAKSISAMRPAVRIVTVEGSSHALPFERPDRVRAAIESAALMAGQARHLREIE